MVAIIYINDLINGALRPVTKLPQLRIFDVVAQFWFKRSVYPRVMDT